MFQVNSTIKTTHSAAKQCSRIGRLIWLQARPGRKVEGGGRSRRNVHSTAAYYPSLTVLTSSVPQNAP